MIIFNKSKKYRFGSDSVIDWVYVGKCTNGTLYDTYTFIDRKNSKRKQFKKNELKNIPIKIVDEN